MDQNRLVQDGSVRFTDQVKEKLEKFENRGPNGIGRFSDPASVDPCLIVFKMLKKFAKMV